MNTISFFNSAKDARKYCAIENIKTHRHHIVVPCKKYLCPPAQYFGRDYINGFTIVLSQKNK